MVPVISIHNAKSRLVWLFLHNRARNTGQVDTATPRKETVFVCRILKMSHPSIKVG